mgnify:CR=1 FL=1
MDSCDKRLGMGREITRRDFVGGVSMAIGTSILPACTRTREPEGPIMHYPPGETGLRGSHPGSFEVAHATVDGAQWAAEKLDEHYDLVVVGAGISGLAAAYIHHRDVNPNARILILDNHDDFGGHAKRNEHVVDGRQVIGWGGTTYITGAYTYEGLELLHDIGLDAEAYKRANVGRNFQTRDKGFELGNAVLFDEETFGEDRLVVGVPGSDEPEAWTEWLQKTPLSDRVRRDIARLYQTQEDYFPGLTVEEKIARLRKMSYQHYLLDVVGMDTAVHANEVMAEGFPDRMARDAKTAIQVMFDNDRLGQKNVFGKRPNGVPQHLLFFGQGKGIRGHQRSSTEKPSVTASVGLLREERRGLWAEPAGPASGPVY